MASKAGHTATVLIVAMEPWLFQATRRGLSLTPEHAPSGIEYEVGEIPPGGDGWQVKLLADPGADASTVLSEVRPALVLLLDGEIKGLGLELVPSVEFDVASEAILTNPRGMRAFPLPKGLGSAVGKMRLRGWRSRAQDAGAEVTPPMKVPHRFASFAQAIADASAPDLALIRVCYRSGDFLLTSPSDPSVIPAGEFLSAFLGTPASRGYGRPPPLNVPPPVVPARTPLHSFDGHIAAFELHATRMFEHVVWPAPDAPGNWHVILGDNASGKTSLLRALALTLLDREERDALRQDWASWLRHGSSQGRVDVTLSHDNAASQTLSLALRRTPRNGGSAGHIVDVQSSETLRYGGFLAAYGPFRRFTGGDPEWLKSFHAHPRTQRVITLFEERAALSDALEWMKDLWVRAQTVKPPPPEKAFLKKLRAFINGTGFLPPGVELLEPNADGVWCVDGNGQRVLAIELSDGYRAALSLVLDLLRHLAAEYGHDKVFVGKSPHTIAPGGIVLIDEPDAHLHPTWQQRIGDWFKRCFPNMQFLVSTHSPIVCQAADSVLLLPAPGDEAPARMATRGELDRLRYGDVLDAFATDFFGRKVTRSEAGRVKLARLATLNTKAIREGLDEAERAEQERLRGELGTVGSPPGHAP